MRLTRRCTGPRPRNIYARLMVVGAAAASERPNVMRLELDSTLTGPGHIVLLVLVGLLLAGSAAFFGAKLCKLAVLWWKANDRRVGAARLLVPLTFYSAVAGVLIYLLLLNLLWPAPSAVVLDDRNLVIESAFPGGTRSVARAEVRGIDFETTYVGIGERPRTRRAVIRIRTADGDIMLRGGRRGLEQQWEDAVRQLSASL